MLAWYSKCLVKRPMITNCLTAASIMMSGDAICQTVIENKKSFDKERTLRFGIYGLIIQAPIVRMWYVSLERIFPAHSKSSAIKKLFCDQIFFAPFIQGLGLITLEFMRSRSLEKVKENYMRNFRDVLINAYKVWPISQCINFFLIPLKYRVVFGSTIAFFWNIYFTWKINQ